MYLTNKPLSPSLVMIITTILLKPDKTAAIINKCLYSFKVTYITHETKNPCLIAVSK